MSIGFRAVAESSIGSIFLRTLAPRYYRSMYISMGLTAVGILAAGVLVRRKRGHGAFANLQALHWRRQNRIHQQLVAEGAPDQPELGDNNPHFV